jgi:hypothetical protein
MHQCGIESTTKRCASTSAEADSRRYGRRPESAEGHKEQEMENKTAPGHPKGLRNVAAKVVHQRYRGTGTLDEMHKKKKKKKKKK